MAHRSYVYNEACNNSAYVGMTQIAHWNVLAETKNILLKTDQNLSILTITTFHDKPFISYMLRQGF